MTIGSQRRVARADFVAFDAAPVVGIAQAFEPRERWLAKLSHHRAHRLGQQVAHLIIGNRFLGRRLLSRQPPRKPVPALIETEGTPEAPQGTMAAVLDTLEVL